VLFKTKPLFLGAVVLLLAFWPLPRAKCEMTFDTLNNALESAEDLESNIPLPQHPNMKAQAAAQSSSDYINTDEFKERVGEQTKRLKNILYNPAQITNPDKDNGTKGGLLKSEKILVFISSSVPKNTLRAYMKDIAYLDDPNISIVMRGFIDGMSEMQPTFTFIQKLLVKDRGCDVSQGRECDVLNTRVEVDPLVFRLFNITAVPAILYVQNIHLADTGQSMGKDDNLKEMPNATAIYGDIPFCYALEKIYEKTKKGNVNSLIKRLKNEKYY